MKYFTLNNGMRIPAIGFGTYPQKESLPVSVRNAYKAGYRLFDISDNYHNEEFLGEAISTSDNNMEDALIISKFSQPYRTNELINCFAESSEKLAGRVDIYLLHWPYPYLWQEQWRRMEELYSEGRCKGIGVCNFEIKKIEQLLSFCKVKPVINQIERHPFFQQSKIVDYCKKNDIQVMCYSPTARQDKELYESSILKKIANKYEKTIGQIILKWEIQTDTIPIPGSKSEKHIRENYDIEDFALTNDEVLSINDLECGKRIRYDPKTRFTQKEKVKFALHRLKL